MNDEVSTLKVLETIEQDSELPQRAIARRTGLNLAKVNFLLRKLAEKGMVKLRRVRENPHKLRYLYLLTPEGMAEKTRLTYRFLRRQLGEYDRAERLVADRLDSMARSGARRIVLWGRNEITRLCLRLLGARPELRVVAVLEPARQGAGEAERLLRDLAPDAVLVCDVEEPPPNGGGSCEVWSI